MKNQLNLLVKDAVHLHFEHVRRSMSNEFADKFFSEKMESAAIKTVLKNIRLIQPWLKKEDQQFNVLDVGMGTGKLPVTLRAMGYNVYGIDDDGGGGRSTELLKQMFPSLMLAVCPLESADFPFEDGKFDFVTSLDVIEHLPASPLHFLQEIYRVLKPNGVLFLSNPNPASLYNCIRLSLGKSIYDPIPGYFNASFHGEEEEFSGHWREYTLKELEYMVKAVGFKIEKKGHRSTERTDTSVLFKTAYVFYNFITSTLLRWLATEAYVICRK